MLRSDHTIPLKSRVAYTADQRVTGTVVGHGTVHNADDPEASDDLTYHVVIVKLDAIMRVDNLPGAVFHTPFVPSVLTIID
jgi:hypothetical protein